MYRPGCNRCTAIDCLGITNVASVRHVGGKSGRQSSVCHLKPAQIRDRDALARMSFDARKVSGYTDSTASSQR